MKKLFFFLVLLCYQIQVFAMVEVNSPYIYFYSLDRQEILYEQDSEKEISIASLTKIMTALVALDYIDDLNQTVILTSDDFKGLKEANASQAGFYIGEEVTYEDLLYGLLLPSGADAALALANHLTADTTSFVEKMNEKASELGLLHTHFMNTTGLDEEGHYSSLEDVAIILRAALDNTTFATIFTTSEYKTSNQRHIFQSTLLKTTEKYGIDVSYIKGSKTGYTYDAGLCLASIAEYEGETYLLITAGADYRQGKPLQVLDSKAIYEYFFENYAYQTALTKGDILITLSDENGFEYVFTASENIELYLPKDALIEYHYEGEEILNDSFQKGDKIGEYQILVDGDIFETEDLYLEEEIHSLPVVSSYGSLWIIYVSLTVFLLLFIVVACKKIKTKKNYFRN